MMIHAFKTVLQCIYIASVVSLTGNGERILFYGKKYVLNGNQVIQLNCSSETKPALSYAEILIDGKTAAAATYDGKTQECLLGQSKFKNCSNVCQCSSDGKTFIFTLPLLTTQKALEFSCVMYIINKHQKEVVHLKYSGTDFGSNILDDKSNDTTDLQITTGNVVGSDNRKDTEQTDLYVPLSIVSTILGVLIVIGIIYFVTLKTFLCQKKKDKGIPYKSPITTASSEDKKCATELLIKHTTIDVDIPCHESIGSKGTNEDVSYESHITKECSEKLKEEIKKTGINVGTMCENNTISKETQCDFDNNECETEEKDTCDICRLLGKSRRAKTICIMCGESMCLTCGDIHQAMKVSRKHKLIQIEKIPKRFRIVDERRRNIMYDV